MPILRRAADFGRLSEETIERWRSIPPAVAGDCMNRTNCMAGRIAPLAPGFTLTGHARTISVMAGDNSAVHAALPLMRKGDIIVIAAQGNVDVAIIGEIVVACASQQGVAGFVVDGAIRDAADLRKGPVPIFAAGAVPSGPHKGFGGEIDGTLSCGGVSVTAGDIVLGDDDGIAIVPLAQADAVLTAAEAVLEKEAGMLKRIAEGATTAELQGIAVPEVTG